MKWHIRGDPLLLFPYLRETEEVEGRLPLVLIPWGAALLQEGREVRADLHGRAVCVF